MAEDVIGNEYNPNTEMLQSGARGRTTPENRIAGNQSEKTTRKFIDRAKNQKNGQKFQDFLKGNKGKIFGFLGFGGVSVALMFFGSLLAGPMQIVHAGQVISEVVDTARDITNGRRLARNIQRIGKNYATGAQNSRVSMFTRIPARNFEKKLNAVGYEIVGSQNSSFDSIAKNIQYTGVGDNGPLRYLVNEQGNMNAKEFRKALSAVVDEMPGNKIYKAIMKRTLNKMYGVAWYQGITRLSAKAAAAIGDGSVNKAAKLETWVDDMSDKITSKFKKGPLEAAAKVAGEGASGTARVATKAIGKGIGLIPFVGDIIGGIIGFALNQHFDKEKIQGYLVSSLIVSGLIVTASDNIRYGNIPNTDDDGNYVPQQVYLDLFSQQYIYDDITVYDGEDSANAADAYSCDAASDDYSSCVNQALSETERTINTAEATTTGSSFFSNAPLQAEFDSTWAVNKNDSEYYRGVPTQLTTVGKDETWKNIVNEVIGSITIIGPKDISDMMEEEFDTEALIPSDMGGTAMYGARVQQNDLSASEGAKALTQSEEISLLRETQNYLAEQQMEKSLWARLFDTEDYHSGIATLSRDANWDLTDSSITTQFANVVKTFAAIPSLVANSLGTYTRAASAANPTPYDYGFNMVAYTTDDVDKEPDYWDAEEFLKNEENLGRIKTETLKSCTGATISSDSQGIKVVWGESESWKYSLSNSSECSNYFGDEGDIIEFTSYDADGNQQGYTGEEAVRTVLANYKLLASFAATSADELTDQDLEEIGLNRADVERTLIQDMKDIGLTYESTGSNKTDLVSGDNKKLAQQILDAHAVGDVYIQNQCAAQCTLAEIQYIAENGNSMTPAKYGLTLDNNLMKFIVATISEMKASGLGILSINNIADSHDDDGLNHPKGKAVDLQLMGSGGLCYGPTGDCVKAQEIIDSIGEQYGVVCNVNNERLDNWASAGGNMHAHCSAGGG